MSSSSMAPPSVLAAPALLLMAVACGLCAGGNYYNQALLHSIALHFGVDQAAAGLSVTVAQVAYAVGLLCITPLGDKLERRRMAVVLMLLAAVGHALVGWSGSFAMFMLGTLVAGLFSVAAQVLVPMAAALAAPGHAGRNVGLVLSGLLVGILLSRSVAGGLSTLGGWSLVYQVTAVAMAVMALCMRRVLPTSRHPQPLPYAQVLASMGHLLRTQPALRQRTLASALAFASVSVMFATMALVLSSAPLQLSDAQIGAWVGQFLLPLFRIAALLMSMPLIGTQLVPMRVRLYLAVAIAVVVVPGEKAAGLSIIPGTVRSTTRRPAASLQPLMRSMTWGTSAPGSLPSVAVPR
jgi:predicted MFS family arabinose efflux permease